MGVKIVKKMIKETEREIVPERVELVDKKQEHEGDKVGQRKEDKRRKRS